MTKVQLSYAAGLLILALGLFVLPQTAGAVPTQAGSGDQQPTESPDLTADLPADAIAAYAQYEEKARAALDPLQKKYVSQLQTLKKKYIDLGNNQAARAIQAQIEKANANLAAISPFRVLEGVWSVKYTNGATRTYAFKSNGSVRFSEERKAGRLIRIGNDYVIDFGDDTAERVTLKAQLLVDHFNPASAYKVGAKPTLTGVGEKGR